MNDDNRTRDDDMTNTPAQRPDQSPARPSRGRVAELMDSAHRYKSQLAAMAPFPDRQKQGNFCTRLLASYATSLQSSPKVMTCTNASLVACLQQLAQLGLIPDGVLGQAHIVAFKQEAQIIVGYRGLVTLVSRSGLITGIHAACVREGDDYCMEEGPRYADLFRHTRAPRGRGEIVYAYAYGMRPDGQPTPPRVHERPQLEAVRDRWKTKPGSAWAVESNFEPMCEKTMVRQLVKTLPQSAMDEAQTAAIERMHRAANLDERAEMSIEQELPPMEGIADGDA